ncbi:hypothetical protein QEG23_000454 [Stenotrophomonas maltophilia]|uniref:Transmembrane protein n=1 Tax=Stenotrophomonas maltophilia TaxID=40324 RepID=A0AAI9BYJ6_STEMA|nr:hypothetical protein [Stenotrophomonas maltophilia]
MAAECFVITKADWDQLMLVFGGMCLLITVFFVLSLIDWDVFWRLLFRYVKVQLRRRRIRRHRGAADGR